MTWISTFNYVEIYKNNNFLIIEASKGNDSILLVPVNQYIKFKSCDTLETKIEYNFSFLYNTQFI